jgi:hypothetical protein
MQDFEIKIWIITFRWINGVIDFFHLHASVKSIFYLNAKNWIIVFKMKQPNGNDNSFCQCVSTKRNLGNNDSIYDYIPSKLLLVCFRKY